MGQHTVEAPSDGRIDGHIEGERFPDEHGGGGHALPLVPVLRFDSLPRFARHVARVARGRVLEARCWTDAARGVVWARDAASI